MVTAADQAALVLAELPELEPTRLLLEPEPRGTGPALTWAAHSSVAIVLLVMSFAEKGVVPFYAAMALVIGANIGTALNPFTAKLSRDL